MVVGHVTPYKLKKECCLLRSCLADARRMLVFMVEQVFLPMGKFGRCQVQMHNAQCGERGDQRAEKNFLCFSVSCIAMKYEFHFTRGTAK